METKHFTIARTADADDDGPSWSALKNMLLGAGFSVTTNDGDTTEVVFKVSPMQATPKKADDPVMVAAHNRKLIAERVNEVLSPDVWLTADGDNLRRRLLDALETPYVPEPDVAVDVERERLRERLRGRENDRQRLGADLREIADQYLDYAVARLARTLAGAVDKGTI